MRNKEIAQPQPVYVVDAPSRGRGSGCLIWGIAGLFCLLAAVIVVIASAYAGWNSGVDAARANATGTVEAELQAQCALLDQNLVDGKVELAQSRIKWLQIRTPVPGCLLNLAPAATTAHLAALPSSTPAPTETALPTMSAALPTLAVEPQTAAASTEALWDYDLDALLAEASAELAERDYSAAIQTLEAIVSINDDYQRERVRGMLLDALTAKALILYRSFKLSEAIVLTERAQVYGDVGELNYERFIADTFLIGQRLKTTNPAEAVRRFSEIVYQHNSSYMNGQVVGELQDALRYYADALLLQGDACLAREQFAAALALQPSYSLVSRGALTAKQQEAAQACGTPAIDAPGQAGPTPAGTAGPIGVRNGANNGQ